MVVGIHPFELYKLFVEIRTHFSTEKFIYGINKVGVKYDNFYNTKNYIHFEKMSNKISKVDAEKLFVSNFIKNPKVSIHEMEGSMAKKIKTDWIYRLQNIDYMFESEIRKVIKHMKYKKSIDLYNDLSDIKIYDSKDNHVDDVSDLLFNKTNKQDEELLFNYLLRIVTPETLVILNDIYKIKHGLDFLYIGFEKSVEPKGSVLASYKYSSFINTVEGIFSNKKYPNINSFLKNC